MHDIIKIDTIKIKYKKSNIYTNRLNTMIKCVNNGEIIFSEIIKNAKGAGIIPYCYYDNKLMFLMQITNIPDNIIKKKRDKYKYGVYSDFGGKREKNDCNAVDIACREFSEETSLLVYLNDIGLSNHTIYNEIKNYSHNTDKNVKNTIIEKIKNLIDHSINYFKTNLIREYLQKPKTQMMCNNGSYVLYLLEINYINPEDLPVEEDITANYETKYNRKCYWISYDELNKINYDDMHKRLKLLRFKENVKKIFSNEK
jgi:hypothetical protein